MIQKITIQNVALIDYAEIEFCNGLNVLSGETGAGKSVILDSVNFVLGAKADKSMIRYGEQFCAVHAEFTTSDNAQVKEVLQELDIEDEDDLLIVSRKFTLEGKSSIKINGLPVTSSVLRKITSCLVDVHGQSEHFYLLKESNQLKVLDSVCDRSIYDLKEKIRSLEKEIKGNIASLSEIGLNEEERERKLDVLSYQIDEITSANIEEGEQEELLLKRNKMNSVEKILTALQGATQALEEDGAGIDAIRSACRSLSPITDISKEYEEISNRLEGLLSEAEDVTQSITSLSEDVNFDPAEAEETERRLEEIKKIFRKYGGDLTSVQQFLATSQQEYDKLVNSSETAEKLTKDIENGKNKLYKLCQELTTLRKKGADEFCKRVIAQLKTLNIPSAQFEVKFTPYEEKDVESATADGLDNISFEFSANAGEPVKPMSSIISGGEMSRFMLALKTQLSGLNGISTYIFDEIDAGISGTTAKVVAEKFADIAKTTQIIAVSHLAQIACMADREFLIEKSESEGKTHTNVFLLDEEGRIDELCRLLSADKNNEIVRTHAKQLLEEAKNYKQK